MTDKIEVTWILANGQTVTASVPVGHSLMEAAVSNNVTGVIGDCGGAMACATCHVVVEHTPMPLTPKSPTETDMLDFSDVPPEANSRLSCQIKAAPALDGIILRVPGD